MIHEDRKDHFYTKNTLNYKNFKQNDLKTVLYDKFFSD